MWNKVDKVWLELALSFGIAAFCTITLIVLVLYRYVCIQSLASINNSVS